MRRSGFALLESRVAIELTDFIASVFLPLRNLVDDMFEVLFQSLDRRLHILLCFVWPRAEFLRRGDLTILDRR